MSKSEPKSCLFLDDEDYERKIMKAVTDVNYDLKRAIVELYKSLNNL